MIELKDITGKNENQVKELIFNQFLDYGKKTAKYIASKHNMSLSYCTGYIASGLYTLTCERYNKEYVNIDNIGDFNTDDFFVCFLSTKKLIKVILGNTNYKTYDIEKGNNINSTVIDIIDVLEQRENRTNKKTISYDSEENSYIRDSLQSYYDTPETALMKKLSYYYSYQKVKEIKSDKKINRVIALMNRSDKLENSDRFFLNYFRKKHNIESITNKELFYLISNY